MSGEINVVKLSAVPKFHQRQGGIYVKAIEKLKTVAQDEAISFTYNGDGNVRSITSALYSAAARNNMLISVTINKESKTVFVVRRKTSEEKNETLKDKLVTETLAPTGKKVASR